MMRAFLTLLACGLSPVAMAAGWMPLGGSAPSAAGLGVAYAGSAARLDDPSVVAANPAGMANSAYSAAGTRWSIGAQSMDVDAEPRLAGTMASDVRDPVAAPYLYVSNALNDRWSVGLAVSSPYAFEAHFGTTWPGNTSNQRIRVQSQNVNPALAYRVSDALSIGGGLNYETLRLTSESSAAAYQSKDAELGWNVGALYELSPYMRLGLTYRSAVQHRFQDGVNLDSLENLTFSVWQRYSDEWEAVGEIARYRLSGLGGSGSTIQQAGFAYQDAWRFAWGAAYRHDDRWKSRFGIMVDRADAKGSNQAAMLGNDHATWLTLGVQYRVTPNGALDAGVAIRWPSQAAFDSASGAGEYRVTGCAASVQYSHAY